MHGWKPPDHPPHFDLSILDFQGSPKCVQKEFSGFSKLFFKVWQSTPSLKVLSINFAMDCMQICGQMKHGFGTLRIYHQLVTIPNNSRNSFPNSTKVVTRRQLPALVLIIFSWVNIIESMLIWFFYSTCWSKSRLSPSSLFPSHSRSFTSWNNDGNLKFWVLWWSNFCSCK